jgi:hypothetical protein
MGARDFYMPGCVRRLPLRYRKTSKFKTETLPRLNRGTVCTSINAMTVPRCQTSSRNRVIALSRMAYIVCPFSSVHLPMLPFVGFLTLAVYIRFG